MTRRHRPASRTLLAAVAAAVLALGAPVAPQESSSGAVAELSRFVELKTELMTRLQADDPGAVPLAEQVLELTAGLFGQQHPENVNAVVHLAYAQQNAGRYLEARSHYELALGLAEKLLGPGHPLTGVVLYHSGSLLATLGEPGSARPQLERSLSIMERSFPPDSAEVAPPLNALGNLLHALGDLDGARRQLGRVVEILEKQLGPDHPETGTALGNLAMVLQDGGDLKAAQELMERALSIDRLHFGDGHLKVATNYNNLGLILSELGNPGAARMYLEKALAIKERELPPNHPDIAVTLVNLGGVLNELRLYPQAEQMLSRAEAIQRNSLGKGHPHLSCTLSSLQRARQGQDTVAPIPFDWGAVLRQMGTSPDFRSSGVALNNAACADVHAGNPEAAIRKLRSVIAAQEETFGTDHPELVSPLVNLATTLHGMSRSPEAVTPTARALDIEEEMLAGLVARGTLDEAGLFLDKLHQHTNWALTLQLRASGIDAVRLGLTTVLRRKGRDLEVRARPRGGLDDPEIDELTKALRRTREEWTFLHLRGGAIGGAYSEEMCRLTFRLRVLSAELRKVHHRLGKLSSPEITIAAVRQHLPAGTALIEITLFDPLDPAVTPEEAAPRYLAYVLPQNGEPSWVDLGEAEAIDRAVAAFRDSLDGGEPELEDHAGDLDKLTMALIRPLLRGATTLLLSPDGALNLVPFAALVDEEGSYLVERYHLSYLSSGRDLLRDETFSSRDASLILGDPEFGAGPRTGLPELETLDPASLPGTRTEAKRVAEALDLEPARLLLGAAARESAVKQARAPRILHLATHGFFFGDPTPEHKGLPECLKSPPALDPLLRSGLLLAEARPASPSDDGILTAAEVMDLDLAGTEIVTLSACETGVGEVRPGRGVYGLRRALVLAGARTQVMSLWPVDDRATAALMESFYVQIAAGTPRGEALRLVQLAALEGDPLPVTRVRLRRGVSPRHGKPVDPTHPYLWAGFILAGDTGPLENPHPGGGTK